VNITRGITAVITMICGFCIVSTPAAGQEQLWWQAEFPENLYMTTLENADEKQFEEEFEYPVLVVMGEGEKKQYKKIKDFEERRKYIIRYIEGQNENPLLPFNYWLMEFARRYQHVRTAFAMDKSPYFDVRGEIYLQYGKPYDTYTDPGGIKWIRIVSSRPTFRVAENESWYYNDSRNNFIVHFARFNKWKVIDELEKVIYERRFGLRTLAWAELVKQRSTLCPHYSWVSDEVEYIEYTGLNYFSSLRLLGNFADDAGIKDLRDQSLNSRTLERIYLADAEPNVSTIFSEISKLDFFTNIVQFRNPDGRTRLQMTFTAPVDNILQNINPEYVSIAQSLGNMTPEDSLNVEFQFMIRDSIYTPLVRYPIRNSVSAAQLEKAGLPNIISMVSVPMKPLHGDLTVQVRDLDRLTYGFKKLPLSVRDFSGDELMISDLQFYMLVEDQARMSLLPVSRVDRYTVAPYPYMHLKQVLTPLCYFEIYNIMKAGMTSSFRIDITSTRIEKSLLEKIGQWFTRGEEYEIGISFNRQVSGNDSNEMIGLDISSLKPGIHVFEIIVTDPENDDIIARAERRIEIRRF